MPMSLSMEKFINSASFFRTPVPDNIPVVFLVAFSIILFTLIIFRSKSKSTAGNSNLPPGPWKLPMIGNLHQLVGHEPHRRLKDLAHKYGPDVMHMQLGELPHIIISSPEAAEQVMKTHDLAFASRPTFLATDIIFYQSNDIAFAPYGEHWRQMRKISVLELFSSKRVLSFRAIREEEVSNLIQLISRNATVSDQPVNLTAMMSKLSSCVTSRAAFGKVQELDSDFMLIMDNLSYAMSGFKLSDLYPSLKFLPRLSGYRANLEKMHKALDRILEQIIDEHKSKKILGFSTDDQDHHEDLVDVLLNLQDNNNLGVHISMDAIKAVTLELFFAGIDTSSTTIEWIMSEMIKHPSSLAKAQEEVRQVCIKNRDVKETSLDQLTYLDMVIAETLRLHPPIPLLVPRETRDKVVLNGFDIPIKTKVIVNAWAINRDSRYWADAEKFIPERFIDCSTDFKGTNFHFIPFGAGRRMCPGMSFGMATVKLTLASLLFHFDWKLPAEMKPESIDMRETFGMSLRRKCALHLIPVPCTTMP